VEPWRLPLQDNADWGGGIQAQKIDVIHAGPIPSVAATVAKITDAPLVVMSWGSDILLSAATSAEERQRAIEALQRADVILGDCRAVIKVIKSWIPQLATPYIQFPWGLDLSRFHELPKEAARDLRGSLHWEGKTVFISTRSWEDIYGVDRLIQAFAMVSARLPGTRLLLLSDGSMRERVHGAIAAYGLEDLVHCPGRIDESALPAWFGAADVYVSTAICDGTSVSLLEAMACRLPVVVHDRYGNTEWIANGTNGWLADCLDVRSIASGMEQAVKSPELWANIGDRNRQDVWDKADWDKNSLRLSEAYEVAVERHRLRT
jgi:glycosyltransferase involved in cell wall biosynthesis